MKENDKVSFDVEQGDKGPKAVNVVLATEEAPAEEEAEAPAEEVKDEAA